MALRMKRNLPLIIFLFGFLFVIVFFFGSQHVSAYSFAITIQSETSKQVVEVDQSATTSQFNPFILHDGEPYNISVGDSSTGADNDGLYLDGLYAGGT